MTNEQRMRITNLRNQGYGYTAIAKKVALSKDSVRAFCKVYGLAGVRASIVNPQAVSTNNCLNCGALLNKSPTGRKKKFCCAACRQSWWNAHQNLVKRKAIYPYVCPACGRSFTAYGNSHRKYCSHACYISFRFKGGAV